MFIIVKILGRVIFYGGCSGFFKGSMGLDGSYYKKNIFLQIDFNVMEQIGVLTTTKKKKKNKQLIRHRQSLSNKPYQNSILNAKPPLVHIFIKNIFYSRTGCLHLLRRYQT